MGNLYILQIFRGIAAIFVLSAHASLYFDDRYFFGIMREGTSGVDFFFVLSGFIIYYVHHNDIGKPNRFLVYLKKRFIRIYPIYWFYTFIYVLIIFTVYLLSDRIIAPYFSDINDLIKSLSLYPLNRNLGESTIIAPAWSLSYEIMFYIIFGITILIKQKYSRMIIVAWVFLIFAIFFQLIKINNFIISEFIFNPMNLEFLCGCLIAFLTLKFSKFDKYYLAFIVLGIIYLIFSWMNGLYHVFNTSGIKVFTYGISYSLIIFGAVLMMKYKVMINNTESGRIKKFFVYLGDASYSIYLIHFIPLFLLSIAVRKSNISHVMNSSVVITILIILMIAISCASYKFIEKPLTLSLKRKLL
jgi:exopolysaccharide production protein ExoZ